MLSETRQGRLPSLRLVAEAVLVAAAEVVLVVVRCQRRQLPPWRPGHLLQQRRPECLNTQGTYRVMSVQQTITSHDKGVES